MSELTEFLKECERLDQTATPGPWYVEDGGEYVATKKNGVSFDVASLEDCLRKGRYPNSAHDADFIAFARTALPRLARELATLLTEREDWKLYGAEQAASWKSWGEEWAEKCATKDAELCSLRDSCEALRVEIERLKNLLNERSS